MSFTEAEKKRMISLGDFKKISTGDQVTINFVDDPKTGVVKSTSKQGVLVEFENGGTLLCKRQHITGCRKILSSPRKKGRRR